MENSKVEKTTNMRGEEIMINNGVGLLNENKKDESLEQWLIVELLGNKKFCEENLDFEEYDFDEDKRKQLIWELFNLTLCMAKESHWYTDYQYNSMDNAIVYLESDFSDLSDYYGELNEEEKEVVEETVMNLVAVVLRGLGDIKIFHNNGRPSLIGNKEIIKENFEGEVSGDYGLDEEFEF